MFRKAFAIVVCTALFAGIAAAQIGFPFPGPGRASGTATNAYNAVANWSSTKLLSRTPGANGNRQLFTASFWIKKAANSQLSTIFTSPANFPGGPTFNCGFGSALAAGDTLQCLISGTTTQFVTSNTFASTTSWYHVCVAVDTTQGTAANRNQVTVNASGQTLTGTNYALNDNVDIDNTAYATQIGFQTNTGAFNGKVAHITFVDGAQVACSSFEQAGTGGTVPKAYTGTFGTNGFLLNFSNTSSLGADTSGNANNLAVNSLTSGDASSESVFY